MKKTMLLLMCLTILGGLILCSGIIMAGEEGYGGVQSLFIHGVGARALALGNAYVAMPYDATAIYWNPAGLDHLQWKNLSVFYTTLPFGTQLYFLGYAHPTINFGTFGIGTISIGTDDIKLTDDWNVSYGYKSYSHQQFLLSYGKQLPWDFAVGLNLKVERQSNVGFSASGVGVDLGLMYTPQVDNILLNGLALGMTIQNFIEPRLKLDVDTDIVPLNFRFGAAKPILRNEFGNQFTIVLDFEQGKKVPFKYHFGTEYVFQNTAMLRVGMNNNQLSFGAGAALNMFQVDYCFGKFAENDFSPSHRISFTVKIGKSKNELIKLAEERKYEEAQRIARQQVEFDRDKKLNEGMERGKTYLADGDYARAMREFSSLITNYEKEVPDSPIIKEAKKLAEVADQQNNKLLEENYKKIAAKSLEEEKREKEKITLNLLFKQGMAYFEGEDYARAIEEWKKMLEIDPNNELAKQYIETANTEHEQQVLSIITRADGYGRSRKYLDAIRELNNARRLSADEKQIRLIDQRIIEYQKQLNFLELFQQGYTYYIQKDFQNAMASFQTALALQPNDATVKKYYTDAEARANARKEPMSESVKKRYLDGVKLFSAGKYEEALKIWEEIQKLLPYNKEILDGIDLARERIEQQRKGSKKSRTE